MSWYALLIYVVAAERLAELMITKRNVSWSLAHGGFERGRRHYRVMVVLHGALLVGCLVEVAWGDRSFVPALAWPMLVLVAASQGLRWWCIATLGRQWNTRVVVVPGMSRVTGGPYRFLRHPNYVAVAIEGIALPLVHSAWITAAAFSVLNAAVLRVRIGVEEAALAELS